LRPRLYQAPGAVTPSPQCVFPVCPVSSSDRQLSPTIPDAFEGSLHPSVANISPVVSFNSEHCTNTWLNKSFTPSLFVEIQAAMVSWSGSDSSANGVTVIVFMQAFSIRLDDVIPFE
jgi:hypothetical protein